MKCARLFQCNSQFSDMVLYAVANGRISPIQHRHLSFPSKQMICSGKFIRRTILHYMYRFACARRNGSQSVYANIVYNVRKITNEMCSMNDFQMQIFTTFEHISHFDVDAKLRHFFSVVVLVIEARDIHFFHLSARFCTRHSCNELVCSLSLTSSHRSMFALDFARFFISSGCFFFLRLLLFRFTSFYVRVFGLRFFFLFNFVVLFFCSFFL